MDITNKVIVITGAAQGLGRAMAERFAKQHAHLALVDLNEDKLLEAVNYCQSLGAKAHSFIANVADETSVENLFEQVSQQFGRVDVLINNAGVLRDRMLVKVKDGQIVNKMSLAEWQSVIDVNLTGLFLCGRECAAKMIEKQQPGVIINISSIARAGNIGQTNYAAAKAGAVALTVTWAKELARHGIRCAAIAPGFIGTEMTASMKPEALERMTSQIPLGRMGAPDEIAQAAEFILQNDYFSGRVVEVDGAFRL
ncbi:SDR family oxidoreductase [Endozoicomonas sp. SM1973]|uniref:SDR family oxidoreductase n=1 Tax=Spartinivicinus marinus TaxID=2994442 RepID=A0A853IF12_9GAMM|nr:SDR family oxidoreductase [Spartinivicinus marinus]MCX4028367.1 SDR family oxidoreductase [Spartinivicinus marinus]NYZ68634.1 SDR family oxidoreductase [Spartinivicinus marinus]